MTLTLNDPSLIRYMDEDRRQEFYCLILEGFSEKEAYEKSAGADDRTNSRRLSGPTTGDSKHGKGDRPIISDMTYSDIFEDAPSLTQDTRTVEEREADWARDDYVRNELLSLLTDRQRELVIDIFGFDGEPMPQRDIADKYGISYYTVKAARRKAINRIRRILENPPLTDEQKRARKREQKRLQTQRYRARQKNVVAAR